MIDLVIRASETSIVQEVRVSEILSMCLRVNQDILALLRDIE